MAEEWLNCTVWVSSEVLEATRANGSDEKNIAIWLPGKILDLSFINETDQIWRITLSLDSKRDYQNNSIENVDAENDSQPMEEKILTVEAKGALNQRNSFEFEGFHHRDPSNDSHLEYDDLAHLPYVNEPEILSILQSRYQLDQPFIFIGPILLAMNPFQAIELYDDASIHKYISYGELRNLSNLPPHVYKIADAAYHHMLLDLFDPDKRENQTIVITGDSGSGKTECSKYLVHYFCLLSQDAASWHGTNSLQTAAQSHVENTIEELVRSTDAITESLGNAKTLQNDNSSRFGKYIELSYSPAGKIEGVSIRTYLLECTRVTHHSIHERNFHIFYQLHAGLSEAEKTSFGFESLDCFHYLSHESLPSQQRDLEKYQELNTSFDLFHISRETRQEMFKVFIGILHIGNIEFIVKPSSSSNNNNSSGKEVEECEISLLESVQFHLRKACELMGYTLDTLRDILCGQKATVKGKEVETKNSISSALAMRDRLSKTLYYSLFKWIMSEINFVLSESASTEEGDQNPNPLSWIGILDIFGFENIEQNSLEQLCKSPPPSPETLVSSPPHAA
jgi:myosin V